MKINIHKIINLKVNNPVVIHFNPFKDNYNVRCLNGNAHANKTTDINNVTCPLCLNPNTGKGFWSAYENKNGNVNKVM